MRNIVFFFSFILGVSCSSDDPSLVGSQIILTAQEITDLNVLREEEKLARDVYLYAYDRYGLSIFNNIYNSEQTHMDKVLTLLNKYGLEDSAHTEIGIFNNSHLADLYVSLTSQVDVSLLSALKVGATIEDLDINDINEFISRTQQSDIITVYESLNCGSKNHIRSFNSQILALGDTYTPQFISTTLFNDILSQPNGGCGN